LGAQDPEDALEMAVPVLTGASEHFVDGDGECGGKKLFASLVGGVAHGFLDVVEGLVVVFEWCVMVMAFDGVGLRVNGGVVTGDGKDSVHKAGVTELRTGVSKSDVAEGLR
jgi:hypothetical protein